MFTLLKKSYVGLLLVAIAGHTFAADPDFGPAPDELSGSSNGRFFQQNSPGSGDRGSYSRSRMERPLPSLDTRPDQGSWSRDLEYSRPMNRPSYDSRIPSDDSATSSFDRPARDRGFGGRRGSLNRDPIRSTPGMGPVDPADSSNGMGSQFSNYRSNRPYDLQPAVPKSTPQKAKTLSVDEKITRRYSDPRMIRLMSGLGGQAGYSFYSEISQMIDQRHIEPTSYQQRVDRALEQLAKVPANQSFARMNVGNPQGSQEFSAAVSRMRGTVQVADLNGAMQTMQQVSQISQQTAGIPEGVIALEFATAALDGLDPYSMIMPPEKTGGPTTGLAGSMVGIGVEIESHEQGLKILKAIAGGPAAEATLKKGDLIIAIGGRSLAGMELQQAVDLLTGAEGTSVAMTLRRGTMVGDVTLTRRQIALKSVSEVRMIDPINHVGYIKLETFAENSSKEMDEALWSLHEQGMESLVFDLRGNPGGLLTTAVELCDKFLPNGVIVSTRGRNPQDNTQESAKKDQTWKTPLVVMVDHNSASASEIFAAAIQDNHRGTIVGERSYGKGTVQTLFPMQSAQAGLRLTTAKFYAPSGREMAGAGVTPDQLIRLTEDANGTDIGLNDAISIAVRQITTMNSKESIARTK